MPRGRKKVPAPASFDTDDLISSWHRERPELDLSVFLAGVSLMRLGRLLDQDFGRMCRADYGISSADMRVLFALRRAGPPFTRRPTDLFKALLVTSGAMTKQIDRLEELGLVERLTDPNYGGGFLICMTKKGRAVADAATDQTALSSLLHRAVGTFSPSEFALIERQLLCLLKETEIAFNERNQESNKR